MNPSEVQVIRPGQPSPAVRQTVKGWNEPFVICFIRRTTGKMYVGTQWESEATARQVIADQQTTRQDKEPEDKPVDDFFILDLTNVASEVTYMPLEEDK